MISASSTHTVLPMPSSGGDHRGRSGGGGDEQGRARGVSGGTQEEVPGSHVGEVLTEDRALQRLHPHCRVSKGLVAFLWFNCSVGSEVLVCP